MIAGMKRALVLVALAACDTGLGTDPSSLPAIPCLPGHARDANGCFVAVATIAIDGTTGDWADVPAIPVTSTCTGGNCTGLTATELAIASSGDGNADLYVRAGFGGAPQLASGVELALVIAASPERPGTAGFDRVIFTAGAQRYEKNGAAIIPGSQPATLALTADGFEAQVTGAWLTYQGAARISVVALRGGEDVAASTPVQACFGWRTGDNAVAPKACEVPP
jgi:hypothetical protein